MIDLNKLNLTEEELDELEDVLKNRKRKQAYENNIQDIENNKKYIGKCYKDKYGKYLRVLSSKSSNQYRFECMCFEFPVVFKEDHHLTKMFMPDNAFSTIEFEGIYVEDYPLLCVNHLAKDKGYVLSSLTEISEEEYFNKMNEFIKELQEKIKIGFFDTSKNNKSMFKKE